MVALGLIQQEGEVLTGTPVLLVELYYPVLVQALVVDPVEPKGLDAEDLIMDLKKITGIP